MATQRYYSSTAVDNNLASSINSSVTSITLNTLPIGFPSTFPFTVAIDYDNPLEELVQVTNLIGSTLTVSRADAGNGSGTAGNGSRAGISSGATEFPSVIEPLNNKPDWISFWRVPINSDSHTLNVFGPKPLYLGNNVSRATNAGDLP